MSSTWTPSAGTKHNHRLTIASLTHTHPPTFSYIDGSSEGKVFFCIFLFCCNIIKFYFDFILCLWFYASFLWSEMRKNFRHSMYMVSIFIWIPPSLWICTDASNEELFLSSRHVSSLRSLLEWSPCRSRIFSSLVSRWILQDREINHLRLKAQQESSGEITKWWWKWNQGDSFSRERTTSTTQGNPLSAHPQPTKIRYK